MVPEGPRDRGVPHPGPPRGTRPPVRLRAEPRTDRRGVCRLGRHQDETIVRPLAIEHARAACERLPQAVEYARLHAQLNVREGNNQFSQNRLGEGRRAYERGIEARLKLVRDNPAIPDLLSDLVDGSLGFRSSLVHHKQSVEALGVLRRACTDVEGLAVGGPGKPLGLARLLAAAAATVDPAAPAAEDEARRRRDADRAWTRCGRRSPSATATRPAYATTSGSMPSACATTSRRWWPTSSGPLRSGCESPRPPHPGARMRRVATGDEGATVRADLAASQNAVGLIQLGLGDVDEAARSLTQAFELREASAGATRRTPRCSRGLASWPPSARSRRSARARRAWNTSARRSPCSSSSSPSGHSTSSGAPIWPGFSSPSARRSTISAGRTKRSRRWKRHGDFTRPWATPRRRRRDSEPSGARPCGRWAKPTRAQPAGRRRSGMGSGSGRAEPGHRGETRGPPVLDRPRLYFIRRRQESLAASDVGRAWSLDPAAVSWSRPVLWAALVLFTGDREEYRRGCRQLLERFGQTSSAWSQCYLAITLGLGADAVDDYDRVVRITQEAINRIPMKGSYLYHDLALICLRAGRFEDALRALDDSDRLGSSWPARTLNDPVRAIVCHRLGRHAEARSALEKARQWADQNEKKGPPDETKRPAETIDTDYVGDWYRHMLLWREAEGADRLRPGFPSRPVRAVIRAGPAPHIGTGMERGGTSLSSFSWVTYRTRATLASTGCSAASARC